ncbi:MAG: hypothetical protein M1409_02835 [Actinobacteria bacterium]|nr:hypothetical protein [Actinomycetota bacterium]
MENLKMENSNKKNMDDLKIEKTIKILEKNIKPRQAYKDELLSKLINHPGLFGNGMENSRGYTFIERLIFEKPWKLVLPLSLAITLIARFSLGGMFDKIVISFFTFGGM